MHINQINHHPLLCTWLKEQCGFVDFNLTRLAGDASFRTYFRLYHQNQSYIVMDASPELENCSAFIAIAHTLRSIGLKTPEIFTSDLKQGFLLLSDFGDRLYLKELNTDNVMTLYTIALEALFNLQRCKQITGWTLPYFGMQWMQKELKWFEEWFIDHYLNLKLDPIQKNKLYSFFDGLVHTIGQQPYVLTHRDYHSANLMRLPDNQIGILDFQDAFAGPITYDLASLLRDCYIAWPESIITKLVLNYLSRLQENNQVTKVGQDEFLYWFDMMSIQRHLKALMTFSRKYKRDQNTDYLKHIPRTLNYLREISQRYPQSKQFNDFLTNYLIPAFMTQKDIACVL